MTRNIIIFTWTDKNLVNREMMIETNVIPLTGEVIRIMMPPKEIGGKSEVEVIGIVGKRIWSYFAPHPEMIANSEYMYCYIALGQLRYK